MILRYLIQLFNDITLSICTLWILIYNIEIVPLSILKNKMTPLLRIFSYLYEALIDYTFYKITPGVK
jgi:hypothetical protein